MADRKSFVVAVDGQAAAGKGTLARRIASHFDFAFLDTGSLYRATGLAVLRAGGDPADAGQAAAAAESLDLAAIRPDDLRTEAVGNAASQVAAIPAVRAALLAFQRRFARQPPEDKAGAVLDGRDIGTVVCPDADVKIFVTASLDVRVERRIKELRDRGETVIPARVRAEMIARDARDSGRSVAPMVAAADAWQLDTSGLSADQVWNLVRPRIADKFNR
ncbi:MAG: (d)CMP kinase [Rhodospirillaceae bacterium]|nr:(d)CMP kinase [Rhodospirillaceae bacterium]